MYCGDIWQGRSWQMLWHVLLPCQNFCSCCTVNRCVCGRLKGKSPLTTLLYYIMNAMHAISLVSTRNIHDNIGHVRLMSRCFLKRHKRLRWVLFLLWHMSGLNGSSCLLCGKLVSEISAYLSFVHFVFLPSFQGVIFPCKYLSSSLCFFIIQPTESCSVFSTLSLW